MVKLRKLYISTVVVTIIYSICLFIGGLLIEKVSELENDIYKNIESYIRSEQNYIISSILDKMEYDVLENKLNVDELDEVSKWCNYNYSFIALNNSKTDYFVVGVDSDNIVDSSSLTIKSAKESIYKSSNDILQKDELSSLIKQIKETKESSNELTVEVDGYWIEWKIFPDNIFLNKQSDKKYIFISAINKNMVLENYNDSFGILESIKIFMIIIYTVFLISIIIVLCNISYKEFFKEK